ncbi:hypothetical protein TGAM01_v204401 [Trichoderma gamsii]|uniref:Uncharacterized protein n=1 Tax=Trichoderma gamsii TaxID=398673 RepID=A0A2P4ZRH0_9HYPO|nr:hypothetical protein TGAM01_v204401 [Trichoderma gamsii]PON26900.1 hypothetical protein TGAM01_v204401 [Trichoderma gamsii]
MRAAGAAAILAIRQSITHRTAPQVRATVSTRVCICTCILSIYAQSTMPTKAVDKTGHRTRLYSISKQASLMLVGIDAVPSRYMYIVLYPHLSTTAYDGSTANITIVF